MMKLVIREFAVSALATTIARLLGALAGAAVVRGLAPTGRIPAPALELGIFAGVLLAGVALRLCRRGHQATLWASVFAVPLAVSAIYTLHRGEIPNGWRLLYPVIVLVLPLAIGIGLAPLLRRRAR